MEGDLSYQSEDAQVKEKKKIHPEWLDILSLIFFILIRVVGGRQGAITPWIGHQSIRGHHTHIYTKYNHSHTPTDMFLRGSRKPTQRTCTETLHYNNSSSWLNPGVWRSNTTHCTNLPPHDLHFASKSFIFKLNLTLSIYWSNFTFSNDQFPSLSTIPFNYLLIVMPLGKRLMQQCFIQQFFCIPIQTCYSIRGAFPVQRRNSLLNHRSTMHCWRNQLTRHYCFLKPW